MNNNATQISLHHQNNEEILLNYKHFIKKRAEKRKKLLEQHKRRYSKNKKNETNKSSSLYKWANNPIFGQSYAIHDNNAIAEVVCCICNDGDVDTHNEILFCDNCDLAVHQQCYGETILPEGNWYCKPCRYGTLPELCQCQICNRYGGALAPSESFNKHYHDYSKAPWAHVICGIWLPSCYFKDTLKNGTNMWYQ